MRLDLVLRLPVPDLDSAASARLSTHMANACAARIRAGAAEAEAIRIIEKEVVPQWLA